MPPETTGRPFPGQTRATTNLRFLIVDEDRNDLEYYRSILEKQGYRVQTSDSYNSAELSLKSETFDFVLVGQGTSAFEGRGVVEQALNLDQQVPVVVLSRYLDINCYLEAMQLGAVDYLEKPVSAAEMARVVRTHLPSVVQQAGAAV